MNGQPIPKYLFDRKTLDFPTYQPTSDAPYDSLVKVNLWDKVKLISKIAYGYLLNNKTLHLKIEGSTMRQLKAAGKQASDTLKISEEDLLAAILWKTIATIRKGKGVPLMSYTVNMRFKTSLDINYFGNASTGYLYYTTEEILNLSFTEIAIQIRKGLNDFGDEYASKEAYYLDKLVKEKKTDTVIWKELAEAANNRAFMFDPGHKFPFYAMDFGSGSPSWYELPEIPLSGFVYTIINPDMQSVDMKINLPKYEIDAFLKLYHEAMQPFLAK
jgi:shikimate O-hydroxycinnamoyltransferase